ncbi:MAG: VTT domain-containing protein [Alphaproteobacteria bacterium]|nr:VTT domain-containing protein [Alphaproteobacteria bacterium]MCB9698202.1 VTT domain-containing protein [Alphaproteobacteria bacterium]
MVWTALFLASFVEYVFPPFPGDTLVVAGAALVVAGGLPLAPVAVAVTLGAVAGGIVDLEVGRRLATSGWIERQPSHRREDLERIVGWFDRHGAVALAANRFAPGIRGLFFVAAGAAGVRRGPAIGWASVSALAWNALLIGLGAWLGQSAGALSAAVARWNVAVGIVLALGVAVLVVRAVRRRTA